MDLIADYGSDASVSDKEEDDIKHAHKPLHKPVEIVLSKKVPDDTFVRSVPHIPGNWAGHVFCTIPDTWQQAMKDSVLRFQKYLETKNPPFQGRQLVSHLDMEIHMSLSRPFALQLSSVESFQSRLKERLCHLPTTILRANPSDERILVNDERTRSFWTWPIDPNPTLIAIVEEINSMLLTYDQPPYYDPPLFHISLASAVGEVDANNTKIGRKNKTTSSGALALPLTQIHCTFGTTKHCTIDLLER